MREDQSPTADSIDIEHIPDTLKFQRQWVCWEYQARDGKAAKVPVTPETGTRASTTAPDTWDTFVKTFLYDASTTSTDGIGFVFTETDAFAGVNIDGCIDDTGNFDETAEAIISQLNSYTELSPSGTGLHVLIQGDVPTESNRRGNVEVYDRARFFTVTGQYIAGTPPTVEQRQDALDAVTRTTSRRRPVRR